MKFIFMEIVPPHIMVYFITWHYDINTNTRKEFILSIFLYMFHAEKSVIFHSTNLFLFLFFFSLPWKLSFTVYKSFSLLFSLSRYSTRHWSSLVYVERWKQKKKEENSLMKRKHKESIHLDKNTHKRSHKPSWMKREEDEKVF